MSTPTQMTRIDIFSGFLGAGKTTLIKKLLKEAYAGQRVVLIENEFGQIGIDGGFMKEAGIQVTEMNSGCICCSLVGDFGRALRQVLDTYHPDRILIEPSGVGKLSDVVRAASGVCGEDCCIGALVAVVDAGKCRMYAKNFGEFFLDQIEHAAAVVLTRTDLATAEKIDAEVSRLISEQYARAKNILTDNADKHGQLAQLLIDREVIFTEDVERIFGKRPWKSRADILMEEEEKEKTEQAAPQPDDAPADGEEKQVLTNEEVEQLIAEREKAKQNDHE